MDTSIECSVHSYEAIGEESSGNSEYVEIAARDTVQDALDGDDYEAALREIHNSPDEAAYRNVAFEHFHKLLQSKGIGALAQIREFSNGYFTDADADAENLKTMRFMLLIEEWWETQNGLTRAAVTPMVSEASSSDALPDSLSQSQHHDDNTADASTLMALETSSSNHSPDALPPPPDYVPDF